ncbi:hypothetical protein M408DRAFT_94130 [Serendipita vermifera MAFF 305830]|uniref:Uncharacterized protein n=1 Tax=Serendipita vermifera MAFF 305830 TaxID=933852 RepID=A0A0C3BQF8_SERVB|nr:hypothetical protein M408DRAFT_94130 [Serendipita vermifera MAFF 305830]
MLRILIYRGLFSSSLVNRAQTRVLESIGQPVQTDTMKGLLESQKDILNVVGLIIQQTTSLQASQANLQASLIALMSQSQQISAQMSSMEHSLSMRADSLKEDMALVVEIGRKRKYDAEHPEDIPASKRRKVSEIGEDKITPKPNLDTTGHPSTPVSPLNSHEQSTDVSRLFPSDVESSPDSPLTPLETQDQQPDQWVAARCKESPNEFPVLPPPRRNAGRINKVGTFKINQIQLLIIVA